MKLKFGRRNKAGYVKKEDPEPSLNTSDDSSGGSTHLKLVHVKKLASSSSRDLKLNNMHQNAIQRARKDFNGMALGVSPVRLVSPAVSHKGRPPIQGGQPPRPVYGHQRPPRASESVTAGAKPMATYPDKGTTAGRNISSKNSATASNLLATPTAATKEPVWRRRLRHTKPHKHEAGNDNNSDYDEDSRDTRVHESGDEYTDGALNGDMSDSVDDIIMMSEEPHMDDTDDGTEVQVDFDQLHRPSKQQHQKLQHRAVDPPAASPVHGYTVPPLTTATKMTTAAAKPIFGVPVIEPKKNPLCRHDSSISAFLLRLTGDIASDDTFSLETPSLYNGDNRSRGWQRSSDHNRSDVMSETRSEARSEYTSVATSVTGTYESSYYSVDDEQTSVSSGYVSSKERRQVRRGRQEEEDEDAEVGCKPVEVVEDVQYLANMFFKNASCEVFDEPEAESEVRSRRRRRLPSI